MSLLRWDGEERRGRIRGRRPRLRLRPACNPVSRRVFHSGSGVRGGRAASGGSSERAAPAGGGNQTPAAALPASPPIFDSRVGHRLVFSGAVHQVRFPELQFDPAHFFAAGVTASHSLRERSRWLSVKSKDEFLAPGRFTSYG